MIDSNSGLLLACEDGAETRNFNRNTHTVSCLLCVCVCCVGFSSHRTVLKHQDANLFCRSQINVFVALVPSWPRVELRGVGRVVYQAM